tara:strand:- start:363 stop:1052 length:690 start_codon:yes stop_codon:yes gene_type:complete
MKIYNCGLSIEPGKYKYKCENFDKLVEKFKPDKVTPYTVEFTDSDIELADAVCYQEDKKLDLVVIDLEKIEVRLSRTESQEEKAALTKCQNLLESEKLLYDADFSSQEADFIKTLQLVSYKPCLAKSVAGDINDLIRQAILKAEIVLFFTAGKKEVRAWNIKSGDNILEAAGKIHSDLKRGFIKGEVVNCKELDNFFNMAEARSRGFVKIVDRDYVMQPDDIIEIRFNV